jgi:hypothetical protein
MAGILGKTPSEYVRKQIEKRQNLHGSGTVSNRSPQQIHFLNGNNAWVKLASGSSVTSTVLANSGLSSLSDGTDLAKNNVLFGGTSVFNGFSLVQKEGRNKIYQDSEFGPVPMAGIVSANIKSLNRGSLKKANVNLKVHSKEQFEIINLLYLRLGYTVILEWGNAFYLDRNGNTEPVLNTVIEDSFFNSSNYTNILTNIESKREFYCGNYDGILGTVSNFDWIFNKDGSYDINITILSMGDIIESLKTNVSIDRKLVTFLSDVNKSSTYTPIAGQTVEGNKSSSLLNSMLWLWTYLDSIDTGAKSEVSITLTDGKKVKVGEFINNNVTTLTSSTKTYKFKTPDTIVGGVTTYIEDPQPFSGTDPLTDAKNELIKRYKSKFGVDNTLSDISSFGSPIEYYLGVAGQPQFYSFTEIPSTSTATTTVTNPISDAPAKVAFKILSTSPQYYVKFGYLLQFIRDKIIPLIDNGTEQPPLIDIAYGENSSMMYTLPITISADPMVCIVKNGIFDKNNGKSQRAFDGLESFFDQNNYNKAYPMNIYLNTEFVAQCLSSTTDERGDTNLFSFLTEICNGINRALGGVNNLEPIVTENSNVINIIDTTPIPLEIPGDSTFLELFGYFGNSSNFARNIELKTTITPELASIATVGATAKGYVKGTEAVSFSKLNSGLIDRFNKELIPPSPNYTDTEPKDNYDKDFIGWVNLCYGLDVDLTQDKIGNFSEDLIKKNVSIVTEYYKYLLANSSGNQNGTLGFIPFKLNFTLDGISGLQIYNKLSIDTRFLPSNYGNALDFLVTGVSHELKGNDWTTEIQTTVIGKTSLATILKPSNTGESSNDPRIVEVSAPSGGGTNGAPTNVTAVGGTGPKAQGTFGTAGPSGPVGPEALTLAAIDQIVANAGTTNELRKRIVKIAASYVGQTELPGDNIGWYDPRFEVKMKNLKNPWQLTHKWCNYFTNLCWTEAYTTGNALVPSTTTYQSIWNTKLKNGAISEPLSAGTQVTFNNFAARGQAITKSQAQSGAKLPEPGDMVVFKGSGYGPGHIEIVVATQIVGGKLVKMSTIGGNTSASDPNDGGGTNYKPSVSLTGVVGFCKVQF